MSEKVVDLTRFDFHAKKFYFSESVRAMSAEEVGQYLLLLVSAWLGGKDASLPDNPGMLAREARVTRVSDCVLEMFPIVDTEHGRRRRNETLYEEWLKASTRLESSSERGSTGGSSRSEAKVLAARENGKLGGRRPTIVLTSNPSETEAEPKLNRSQTEPQTNPTQIKPNQPNQTSASQVSELDSSCDQEAQSADWKNIAIRHFRLFSKKPSVKFKDKYFDACKEYSEKVVLDCFDSWASGVIDWVKRENVDQPLFAFFKKLPEEASDALELLEAVQEDDARIDTEKKQAAEQKKREEAANEASIAKQRQEVVERLSATAAIGEDPRTPQEFMDEE